jgi:hypothetical protein
VSLRKTSRSTTSKTGDVNNQSGGFANTGYYNVIVGNKRYSVEAFPSRPQIDYKKLRRQPSKLLSAENQVVPFVLREEELKRLASWRDCSDRGSVMMVHGSGGQGKTRLAFEFAEQCAKAGWSVERACHCSEPAVLGSAVQKQRPRRLVVVDYADRWPREDLLSFFQELMPQTVPTRVLLLARSKFFLKHPLTKIEFSVDFMPLEPLTDNLQQRREIFAQALNCFAEVLGVSRPMAWFQMNLDDPEYRHILVLHMSALVVVDALARGVNPPIDVAEVSEYLLGRERDHWTTLNRNRRIETNEPDMADTVFTATLTGPMTWELAVMVLQRANLSATEVDARKLLYDHAVCYPPVDSASDQTCLMPLLPDRLGEDFLALHLKDNPWSREATRRLLSPARDDESMPTYAPYAFRILVETARRWPNVAEKQLYPLLREHPLLAFVAGGTTLFGLVECEDVPLDVLETIESHLPRQPNSDFGFIAASIAIYSRLVAVNAVKHEPYLVAWWESFNNHLAVEFPRILSEMNAAERELARAVLWDMHAQCSTFLGQHEEALVATKEATRIRQHFVG